MTRSAPLVTVVLLTVLGGCASSPGVPGRSAHPYGETREAQVDVRPGAAVSIRNLDGVIRVSTHKAQRLELLAEVVVFASGRDQANEVLDRIHVRVDTEYDTLVVRTGCEEDFPPPYEVYLHVTVPEGTPLSLQSRMGAVTVQGPVGPTLVSGDTGDVQVAGVHGNLIVALREGAVVASRIQGGVFKAYSWKGNTRLQSSSVERVEVTAGDGSVDLVQVVGEEILAKARGGSIRATECRGNLDLTTDTGEIVLVDLPSGSWRLQTESGEIKVAGCAGDGRIETAKGAVHISRLEGGRVGLKSGTGPILVTRGTGTLEGTSAAGSVDVQGFRGNVEMALATGPLSIQGQLEKVRATTGSGSVTVASSGYPPSTHPGDDVDWELRTSFGTVRLFLPRGLDSELDLVTKVGSVNVELPGEDLFERKEGSYAGGLGKRRGRIVVRSGGGAIDVLECPGGDLNPHGL